MYTFTTIKILLRIDSVFLFHLSPDNLHSFLTNLQFTISSLVADLP